MEQEFEKALKGIEKALKVAVMALQKFAGNDLSHTAFSKEPLYYASLVVAHLEQAKAEAVLKVKYAGLTEEEVTQAQAEERAAELETLQQAAQAKLADYTKAPEVEPTASDEETGEPAAEETGEPDEEDIPPVA
jgi:hypothetical protein